MSSVIYRGRVMHHRLEPVDHRFSYGFYFYGFDLSELPRLDRELGLFGYNRFRPVSLRDRDYLDRGQAPISEKLRGWLSDVEGRPVERVVLITAARYWNYVFNPVSFYLCFDADDQLVQVVAEVNNTFGERHLYLIDDVERTDKGWRSGRTQPKEFHVSPFNDMEGEYRFEFEISDRAIDIRVNLFRDGKPVFLSGLQGKAVPLTAGSLLRTVVRYPFRAAATVPRILLEAARLRWRRGLKVFGKPAPSSARTIRRRFSNVWTRVVVKFLERIREGRLRLVFPDGTELGLGARGDGKPVTLRVRREEFFKKLALGGAVGLGESYVDGDWDSDDVPAVLRLLGRNSKVLSGGERPGSKLAGFVDAMSHRRRRNTKRNSRKNIHEHYDLGNDFYRLFLDPSLMYSSGLYLDSGDTLEPAQANKMKRVIEQADIQADHHVLEIGSGWGAMAIEAARRTGCRVTSITLSEEQHKLASQRVREAGMEDRVEIRICDYRDIEGAYDRIISIEMVEAVGHEFYGDYFKTLDRVLKPGGKVVLQAITIPEERYETYRRRCDWIQKYIFPGGFLPSVSALKGAWERQTDFQLADEFEFGRDYGRTLKEWRARFLERLDEVKAQGFDEEFIRKWEYYLCYCEVGFDERMIHVRHLVLTR